MMISKIDFILYCSLLFATAARIIAIVLKLCSQLNEINSLKVPRQKSQFKFKNSM